MKSGRFKRLPSRCRFASEKRNRSVEIRYLHELGPALRLPHSRHLEDEIYELRAQVEGNISRILYFFVIGDKAVLTHGFVKKTQHTPPKEIKRAEKYRRQYLLQHHIKG